MVLGPERHSVLFPPQVRPVFLSLLLVPCGTEDTDVPECPPILGIGLHEEPPFYPNRPRVSSQVPVSPLCPQGLYPPLPEKRRGRVSDVKRSRDPLPLNPRGCTHEGVTRSRHSGTIPTRYTESLLPTVPNVSGFDRVDV